MEEGRSLRDASWKGSRRKLFLPLFAAAMMLLVFFLGDMSYLFGALYQQSNRVNALNVLVVDFDGGAIGEAVSGAYQSMKSKQFPTLEFQDPSSKYADPAAVKDAVCRGSYWGAMYIDADASSRLSSAVAGEASQYNPGDAVTYIYNQARYTSVADSVLGANFQALVGAARGAYYGTQGGRSALQGLNTTDQDAVQAYLDPIQASADIITPTTQGSRTFYNTLNGVFPIILCFFFVLALNGLCNAHRVWARLRAREIWFVRLVAGKLYTFLAALCITGYVWAFREDWAVPDGTFATNWMIVWFQMDIHWQVFDALLDSVVPMQFAPVVMLTWIIINVTSEVTPFELAAGFYRIGYAFPGFNIYSLQVRAWSGCTRMLHINLPILFAWWLVGHVMAAASVRWQSTKAKKAVTGTAEKRTESEQSR